MFHPAELESRQNDQVVFGEGVWYLCIFLLPFECIEHFGCDIGALCYFLRVGLTMVNRNVPSVARIRFSCQLTGNKREKIGAERFRFPERNPLAPGDGCRIHLLDHPVGERLPGRRNLQRQGEKRFHVRLVETREERTRPVRDQQRIEEFVPAVKRLIVCRKFDSHAVLSVCRLSCIDHDMLVLNRIRDFPAIQQN